MGLEIVRRVRGNLHGSIDLSALEDQVVAHPVMQRLRRIKQTAFLSYVFPGATHTRFEHSLGVMHLAGVAWEKIWRNQVRLKDSCQKIENFSERERDVDLCHGLIAPTLEVCEEVSQSDYIYQALRLAALMHDLGHPAFSHSGERFLPNLDVLLEENPQLPDYLKSYFYQQLKNSAKNSARVIQTSHEDYTLIFIAQILEDIYKQVPEVYPKIDPRDVIAIIKPDVGISDQSPLKKRNLDKFCHELISGEIDVDRMDYLLRDSKESGVIYGIFDANRILDSLVMYYDPIKGGMHLAIQYSGLAAFEDYLRARQSMYLQLYFHKTSVAAEAMLKNLAIKLGNWRLPAKATEYAKVDEYNIHAMLTAEAERKIKDPNELKDFTTGLNDLLLNRRLWKRVFEVTTTRLNDQQRSFMERAGMLIQGMDLKFERISSSTVLTRFSMRDEDQLSQNYLRIIKKDEFRFPRIVPIEDHSDLIKHNAAKQIHRIYAENNPHPEFGTTSKAIVKAITEELRQSKD